MDDKHFDIFLSHSYKDREAVAEVAKELKGLGYTVYIDWEQEPLADRSKVTREFVERLRNTMGDCHAVFFVLSKQSAASGWTPWELGFMDGRVGRVFVLPLSDDAAEAGKNLEYLRLYPMIDRHHLADSCANEKIPKHGRVPWDLRPAGWLSPFDMMEEMWKAWFVWSAGLRDLPAPIFPPAARQITRNAGREITERKNPADQAVGVTEALEAGRGFTIGK